MCFEREYQGQRVVSDDIPEAAVYSCQKADSTFYTPERVEGYEQYTAITDWRFTCVNTQEEVVIIDDSEDSLRGSWIFVSVYALMATLVVHASLQRHFQPSGPAPHRLLRLRLRVLKERSIGPGPA